MKVLVTEPIAQEGLDILKKCAEVDVKVGLKPEEIMTIIGNYEALVVRSQPQVTAAMIQAGTRLQVIGRAGVGVDNIDVNAATQQGVIVVNAPTGNTVSAAEHTIALMLALARHIPQANASLKSGAWKRADFMGTELRGKTLGIIGLGRVGTEVARRALGMEMKLIGFDPFVSPEYAKNIQVTLASLEEVLQQADFVTLHTPLTASTKELIGEKQLAMMKPTARILNVGRGGLINEKALADAVKEKIIAGAAVDVFPVEPVTKSVLFEINSIIVTPHLGASTSEAQTLAAVDVAEQIACVFQGQIPSHSVNIPMIPAELQPILMPFMKVAHLLGKFASSLIEGQLQSVQINYNGEISAYNTGALKAAVLGGILEGISEERINAVNANLVASQRGIKVVESKDPACDNYSSLISVEAISNKGAVKVAGTTMRGEPHIVRVYDYWLDIVPTGGYFLFSDHTDKPGIIGAVGKITGDADINISYMSVARIKPRGQAMMILALDEPMKEDTLKKIRAIPNINWAKQVSV